MIVLISLVTITECYFKLFVKLYAICFVCRKQFVEVISLAWTRRMKKKKRGWRHKQGIFPHFRRFFFTFHRTWTFTSKWSCKPFLQHELGTMWLAHVEASRKCGKRCEILLACDHSHINECQLCVFALTFSRTVYIFFMILWSKQIPNRNNLNYLPHFCAIHFSWNSNIFKNLK